MNHILSYELIRLFLRLWLIRYRCDDSVIWVHAHRARICSNLLWRDVETHCSQVDLRVALDARQDEEDSRTLGAVGIKSAESEYNRSFVLLHHLRFSCGVKAELRYRIQIAEYINPRKLNSG